jgi:hypothetical protein
MSSVFNLFTNKQNKKMKNSLKLIAISLFTLACNDGSKGEVEKLEAEVMAIHDEIMPKMGDIMSLKEDLNANLKLVDSTATNYSKLKQETDSLSYLLTDADNGMMDWMDEYNADTLAAISSEDAAKYLLEQKTKINSVKEITLKNIDAVKKYLKK